MTDISTEANGRWLEEANKVIDQQAKTIAQLRKAVRVLADVAEVAQKRLDWWDAGVADPNCIFYECEDDQHTAEMRAALSKLKPL